MESGQMRGLDILYPRSTCSNTSRLDIPYGQDGKAEALDIQYLFDDRLRVSSSKIIANF